MSESTIYSVAAEVLLRSHSYVWHWLMFHRNHSLCWSMHGIPTTTEWRQCWLKCTFKWRPVLPNTSFICVRSSVQQQMCDVFHLFGFHFISSDNVKFAALTIKNKNCKVICSKDRKWRPYRQDAKYLTVFNARLVSCDVV